MEEKRGIPTAPDHVCIRFRRAPDSLIEEPEVCECCASWQDGLCLRDAAEQEGGRA